MLHVRLLQHHRQVFDGTARQVVLPAESGELSVLDCHAPMLCALTEGQVRIDERHFPVRTGLARVERNRMTILVH